MKFRFIAVLTVWAFVFFGGGSAFVFAATIDSSESFTGSIGVAMQIDDIVIADVGTTTTPVKLLVSHGTLAMGTTTGLTFSGSATGSTLYFSGTPADVNAALASLTYTRTDAGTDTLEVSLVEEGEVFFEGTGHLYEYIADSGLWGEANTAAALLESYDASGYLVTITSAEENSFVAERLENAGWMGASDIGVEGEWRWMTGPEDGELFWIGGDSGTTSPGYYANWADGEPNDDPNEDCAQFLAGGSGEWNDLQCDSASLPGYVVEFGAEGDMPEVAAKNIDITTHDPAVIATAKIDAYADDESNAAPTVEDYTDAGVTGVTESNLSFINAVVAQNDAGEANTLGEIQALADQGTAIAIIHAYADSTGTSTAPTLDDYTDAGITGVTADNLAAMNTFVAESDSEDLDSLAGIQAAADTVVAIEKIKEYADTDGASTAPTVDDYTDAGVTGVTADNLAAMNASVAASDASAVDSTAAIESAADIVIATEKIKEYADTDGASTAPTVADYALVGASGVNAGNLAELNESIAESDAADIASLEDIRSLSASVVESLSRSGGNGVSVSLSSNSSSKKDNDTNESTETQTNTTATVSQLQEKLDALKKTYSDLMATLTSLNNGTGSNSSQDTSRADASSQTPGASETSVRDLELGMEGDDVRMLQELLITQNSGPAAQALMGIGATGYFGTYTQNALAEYQEPNGIVPFVGYFGEITRTQMKTKGLAGLWW